MTYSGAQGALALHGLDADLADGVLTVLLADSGESDASALASCLAMERLLQAVAADSGVRVLVLRGKGEGFTVCIAAANLEADASAGQVLERCANLLTLLPQPVIAVVHGFCRDGALQLVQACDIVYAADDAEFDESSIDAAQAEREGLVTLSFPPAELDGEAAALARELACKDPLALRFTKQTLRQVPSVDWDDALDFNAAQAAELKMLQAGRPSARAVAVESFLGGKSKPGLGS